MNKLIDFVIRGKVRRSVAFALAVFITFTTSYALILPAITLEKDTADSTPGISMGGNEQDGDTSTDPGSEDPSAGDSDEKDTDADTVAFDAEAKNESGETEALVHVETNTGTFPEGTTLEASMVTDQDVIDSIAGSAAGEVVAVHAVDLTFTDENGETVQPAEGSQVSVTLSAGGGAASDPQNEDTSPAPAGQPESSDEAEASDQPVTETTVVQYTEDSGAEPVETSEQVSFEVEPENDLDQDSAVSFDMNEQASSGDTQTYAIVETVAEDDVTEEYFTDEAEEAGPVGAGPAPEEALPEEPEISPEALPEEQGETTLTVQGKAYLVTMIYGPEAGIPQGASLKVEEILSKETAYDDHLEATQKALNEAAQAETAGATEDDGIYAGPAAQEPQFFGTRTLMDDPDAFDRRQADTASAPKPEIVYARFFDITILDENGDEVTPAAPVKVSIELLDADQDEEIIQTADSAQVIHFGEDETELMEAEVLEDTVAGVAFDTEGFSVYGVVYTVDFHLGDYSYSIQGGSCITLRELFEILRIEKDIQDVANVTFSDPALVWVGKVDETTTVGELKEANGLEVQYSAELTEEQIAEINSSTVEAGGWALISVQPFISKESLTVTMKNGEQFVVKVTDAQISTHVITADGEDYIITVTYGSEAGIPDGATLETKEILEGTEEYESMLAQSRNALKQDEDDEVEILFSRFFDVSILDAEGNEIEPESTVSVTIQYADPIHITDAKPSIVHFAEEGVEVIHTNTHLVGDGQEGQINVFEYKQGSFSGIGTIVENDTLENGQYFVIVGDNGTYYAMKNDGSMVAVTYYHQTKQVEAAPGTDENDLLWNVSSAGYGYYTFKAVNGSNYLTLQNGNVVNNSSGSILVRHNAWDESQNETGGYYLYHTPNPWDSNTWNPLCLGYWNNSSHFYVGDSGSESQRIKLYKYAMASTTGEPPETNTYTGIEVNPSELDEWLMSLFDDMPVGYDGYHKTAEVYDYENRIYQIDFTAQSNAQGFASDIDIAFSVDMSNSMLFPSTLTEVGTIELRQSVLENTLEKDQVYFIISDIAQTSTVTAVFYENGTWKHEDASKYARGQRNQSNTDIVVGDYPGYKVQGTDTGFYTLYKADPGYVTYIQNNGTVWENPYNRLADMKQSLRMAFNFLDIMQEKYHATVRVGWNGFARDVQYDNGKTGQSQEKFDYRCFENGHALQNLENVDYNDIIRGFADAGSQTGGGTRPDKAFEDAANMGWGSNTQKYLVLITDGAPQGGGASSPNAALQLGKNEGRKLTNTKGVNIVSIGLSTEHVDGADSLFQYISCENPTPGNNQKMIYQAKDGDALKNAVVDALRIMVSKAITVGTITDTIDPAFYPVSTDGTPLKSGDKIDLSGKLTTDTSEPYGVIGWDDENWTVQWANQDIIWADEEHPYGWHGRVLVKAKENFLGGNDISTNKGDATLDVLHAKVPVKNNDGTISYVPKAFADLMELDSDQLETRYMDTPHVNVDELEMTKNDTEWTVYLNTEVNPGEQMEALFNEIKVMKVVTDGAHEMVVPQGKTSRDVMVYDLVPTEDGNYNYEEASSDARDKRQVDQAFFYLKDLFSMQDSLGNRFIPEMTADQAIEVLLSGAKVEVGYQGYGHSNVGKIILELKADPSAQVNNLDEHPAAPVGTKVEKYILSAEYQPTPETGSGDWYWNTGTFGTKDKGKQTEDKTKDNTHTINVFVKGLQITKVDMDDQKLIGAKFALYRSARVGETDLKPINGKNYYKVAELDTSSSGVASIDPIGRLEDGEQYYLVETIVPNGYSGIAPIPVNLEIIDTVTPVAGTDALYNRAQTASLVLDAESGVKRTDETGVEIHIGPPDAETETVYYRITNNPGYELPSTGGPGTELFTILGTTFILGSGALLIRRKDTE